MFLISYILMEKICLSDIKLIVLYQILYQNPVFHAFALKTENKNRIVNLEST